MDTETVSRRRDLAATPWKALLAWGVPAVLIVVGDQFAEARTVLWTVGFFWAGAACLANARRCRRRHCFYTGPLLLLAALASLLYGLGVLPLGSNVWNWIVGVTVVSFLVLRYGVDGAFGKYVASGSERDVGADGN